MTATNEAAERLFRHIRAHEDEPLFILAEQALAAEHRATVERIMDRIENAVAKPGAFPKRDLMRMFARIRDEEAAR